MLDNKKLLFGINKNILLQELMVAETILQSFDNLIKNKNYFVFNGVKHKHVEILTYNDKYGSFYSAIIPIKSLEDFSVFINCNQLYNLLNQFSVKDEVFFCYKSLQDPSNGIVYIENFNSSISFPINVKEEDENIRPLSDFVLYSQNKTLSTIKVKRKEFYDSLMSYEPLYFKIPDEIFNTRGLSIFINENNNLIEFHYANSVLVTKSKYKNLIIVEEEKQSPTTSVKKTNTKNKTKIDISYIFENHIISTLLEMINPNNKPINIKDVRDNTLTIHVFENDAEYIVFEYESRKLCYKIKKITYINTSFFDNQNQAINTSVVLNKDLLKQNIKSIIDLSKDLSQTQPPIIKISIVNKKLLIQTVETNNPEILREIDCLEIKNKKILPTQTSETAEISACVRAIYLLKILESISSTNINLYIPDKDNVFVQLEPKEINENNNIFYLLAKMVDDEE